MIERQSEQGIQANRPADTNMRITAEEPLPEPPKRPDPAGSPPAFRRKYAVWFLLASGLFGAVVNYLWV
jgi:hypothetical protein